MLQTGVDGVAEQLASVVHGVEKKRLVSQGFGLTKPIDTNDTDAGRAANRRVEFKITSEDSGAVAPPSSAK